MDYMLNSMDLTVRIPQSGIDYEKKPRRCLKTYLPKNSHDLLCRILNTNIGKIYNDYDIYSLENKELYIFDDFIERHKKMQYTKVFQQSKPEIRDVYFRKFKNVKGNVLCHYTEDIKCKGQIHPAQIEEGFQTILFKVVSQELIGNNRNKKKIVKTLQNLLRTARTESLSLHYLLKRLNLSSIKWLNIIDNMEGRFVILAKFIKWLFHYFIKVILSQFFVSSVKEEKVFIFINDWNTQRKRIIRNLVEKMVLQSDNEINDNSITYTGNNLELIPKRDSLRLIAKNNYTEAEKDELKKAMCVLRYLYEEKIKIKDNNFYILYPDICKKYKNCASFYVISADIHDAFGSVKQDMLYDILQQAFESLPDELQLLMYYDLYGEKRYQYPATEKIKARYTKDPDAHQTEHITKSHILKIIKHFIFHTKIIDGDQKFNLCKGLAQGLMLSSILCDIYYANMTKKRFSSFIISGFLFNYVDDSLYITDNRQVAEGYMKIIQKGIPEYNCWYNKSKLQSNLEISDLNINYLGWQIDSKLLEVQPNYLPVRKTTVYKNLSSLTLETKINNIIPLKLSKIIFSNQINSNERIFNNVEIVALQHARRCYSLTKAICENNPKLSIIMIMKTNFTIIRRIEKFTDWTEKEIDHNRRILLHIVWKSFFSVFSKHDDFKNLSKQFKEFTQKYKL